MIQLPLLAYRFDARGLRGIVERSIGLHRLNHFFQVATQHNVGTAASHVGGDGDGTRAPRLDDDVRFAGMLLGVQHLVGQVFCLQQRGNDFGIFNRRGTHQHRLTTLVAFANVFDRCDVFFFRRLVHPVELIGARTGAVGWDHHRFQTINFLEFVGFGVGRARHAGKLAVEAEIVLEGDGRQRLVFRLDRHALFGLHGLVQAIAPATTRHEAAGEFIDDDNFTVLADVVLVAVVEVVRLQRSHQMVQQGNVGRVVERSAFGQQPGLAQQTFGILVPLLGHVDRVRLLVHGEVARLDHALARARIGFAFLAHQLGNQLVDGKVQRGLVFGLAADDQRRACLVDQDRVHLVNDGVVQRTLNPVTSLVHHVVTQVVETVLVVGAVGDVGTVSGLLLFPRCLRQVDAHRQTQKVIQPSHPLGVAAGQVVVHRHHVHAFAGECVQVNGQGGGERLALTRAHFGHFAMVQGQTTHHLHVKMTHLHDALAGLSNHRKSLGQHRLQRLTVGHSAFENLGLRLQLLVAEFFKLRLQTIDALHGLAVGLEQTVVAATENFGEEVCGHTYRPERTPEGLRSGKRGFGRFFRTWVA